VLIITAHLLLFPEARWTGDEYDLLAKGAGHFANYLARVSGWSPRPVSEAFVALYATLVEEFDRPLIMVPLCLCWGALAIAPLLAWRLARRPLGSGIAASLILLALLLLAAKPGEVFYWPGASLAYMPTLAVMAFVVVFGVGIGGWSAIGRAALTQRLALLVALLIGAGCSELGACFACALAAASVCLPRRELARATLAVLPPAILGLCILVSFATHRGQGSELMQPGSPTFRHLGASLFYTVQTYAREFIAGLPPGHATMDIVSENLRSVLAGLALRGLLLYGSVLSQHEDRREGFRVADLAPAAALLVVAFVSLLSAYYNFGIVCCERHETMRQDTFMLATLSVAALLRWPRQVQYRNIALLAAMIILADARLPGLRRDFAKMHEIIPAKASSWKSGRDPGPAMVMTVGPQTMVAGGGWFPPAGHYAIGPDGKVDAPDGGEIVKALTFFGKTDMVVR